MNRTERDADEVRNLQSLMELAAIGRRYSAGETTATETAKQLSKFVTNEVVFWSNYTPSWEPLRPLFRERRGVDEILERYAYEHEHERIEDGSGVPTDIAVAGNVAYYSQRETATFFEHRPVTWEMVTRVRFRDGRMARFEMYLDSAPIEAVYSSERMGSATPPQHP